MKQYGSAAHKRLAELCDVCGIQAKGQSDADKANAFIAWMEDLKVKMNIPKYPDIKEKDLDQIVEWAYKEGNPLYPIPVTWSKDEFRTFLQSLQKHE